LTAYNAALAAVTEADYTATSWTTYKSVVTANVVTVANSQTEVNTATTNITAAQSSLVKKVDANLAEAKAAAITELNAYKASTDYSTANWTLIGEKKIIGAAAINNATTIEAVTAAFAEAKADIDTVKTQVQTYTVTYDANNATTGGVPTDSNTYTSGALARATNRGDLSREGYTFSGWNTVANGGGTNYKVNETFVITSNVTLYAQWSQVVKAQTPVLRTSNVRGTEAVTQDSSATKLSVTAEVTDNGTLSYQWYQITTSSAISGTPISGETSSSYIPSTTSTGITGYYVVVTNTVTLGGETKISTNKSSIKEVIVLEVPPATYDVLVNSSFSNITLNNIDAIATQYKNYTTALIVDSGYTLPNNITVTMGGKALVPGVDYIYSKVTGTLTVYNVTGKLSITAVGALNPTQTYTITFNSNGGSDVAAISGIYGTTIALTIPTKLGFEFVGWYRDSAFGTSYFSNTIGAENLILYAKWERTTYSITGTVKDEETNANVSNATVMLMSGSRQVAQTVSNSSGNFILRSVPNGTYNLVISNGTEQTMTLTITVSDSNISSGTVTLPKGNKNSVVDVKPDTPDIIVGKLNDFFNSTKFTQDDRNVVDAGGTVEIKLIVEKKNEGGDNAATNAHSITIAAGSGNKIGMFLELTLSKIVTPTEGGTAEKPILIDELDDVLVIDIPLPSELQGRGNYVIYRYHGTEVQTITQTKNNDGEYIELSSDGKYIKLHTKKFSTYAIAYTVASTHNTVNVPTITAHSNTGGEITISADKKIATIVPDDGYIISDVLVDGKSVGVTATYTFADRKSHKITAVFIKKSAVPYYMKDGKKIFIGLSSVMDSKLKYTAPNGVTVQFEDNPKRFTDIDNHWAKSNIDFATERELFLGTENNKFSPNTGMTRAMFVTVVGRLYERSYGSITGNTAFADVDTNAYYANYVAWAHENNIIKGIGDNQFAPNTEVTREQMAEIMFRFATFLDKAPQGAWMINVTYPDKADISDWAMGSAAYCQMTNIISGRNGGEFAPKATATRAEVSAVIERFVKEILK